MTTIQPATPARSSGDYLLALFQALPTGVLLADDRAFYVDANAAACALVGRPREQLLRMHVSELVAPARRADVEAQWRAFLRDGSQSGVFSLQRPDGRIQHCAFVARAHLLPGLHVSFVTPVPDAVADAADASQLLTLCAWTKKVRSGDAWISVEQYLAIEHGVAVTHGICPEAEARLFSDSRRDPPQP